MKLKMYQVDAFADKLFSGNPAAVVILESPLKDDVMQSIAAENNLSETAFVSIHESPISIRWFTPSIEVNLCGHATLASARILFEYYHGLAGEEINLDSKSGNLKITKVGQGLCLNFPADYPVEAESDSLFF
jgi:PhzF family phenazine biosynthesis protein